MVLEKEIFLMTWKLELYPKGRDDFKKYGITRRSKLFFKIAKNCWQVCKLSSPISITILEKNIV